MRRSTNFKTVNKDSSLNTLRVSSTTKQPIVDNVTTLISEPGDEGNIVFNRADSTFYGHNGTEWTTLAGGSGAEVGGYIATDDTGTPLTNNDTLTSGISTVSAGDEANASGDGAVAVGSMSTATGAAAVGVGAEVNSTGSNSVAVGPLAASTASTTVAIGSEANSSAIGAISLGALATAGGSNSISIGVESQCLSVSSSIAVGNSAVANNAGIAIGNSVFSINPNSIAIGNSANSTNTDGVAIGYQSTHLGTEAVSLGAYSVAGPSGTAIGYRAGNDDTLSPLVPPAGASTCIGGYTTVGGVQCTAVGYSCISNGSLSTVLGSFCDDHANIRNTLIGYSVDSFNDRSTVIGAFNENYGRYSTIVGYASNNGYDGGPTVDTGIIIGNQSSIAGFLNSPEVPITNGIAIGSFADVSNENAVAIGLFAGVDPFGFTKGSNVESITIGTFSHTLGSEGISIGQYARSTNYSVAIGSLSDASGTDYSIAIGAGAVTSTPSGTTPPAAQLALPLQLVTSTPDYGSGANVLPASSVGAIQVRIGGIDYYLPLLPVA